jgi:hypothetical protein
VQESKDFVFGGRVVEPDGAEVGGVGGVVGDFGFVEGVPAVKRWSISTNYYNNPAWKVGGREAAELGEMGCYYSFVPRGEGSRWADFGGIWDSMFSVYRGSIFSVS